MGNYENYKRKRNIYVGFRLSKEEKKRIDKYVKMSGLTFREYVTRRSLQEDVIIVGNTRVYKSLKEQLESIVCELQKFDKSKQLDGELSKVIVFALKILDGMKNE